MACACDNERTWLRLNLRTLCFGKYHPMFIPAHCMCGPWLRRMYFGLLGWYLTALTSVLVSDGAISLTEAHALRMHFEDHIVKNPLIEKHKTVFCANDV